MGDYQKTLEDERYQAGMELNRNMKELRRLSKHIKSALDAIDAVFDDERKKATSNQELQRTIEERGLKDDNLHFNADRTLRLIRNFLHADNRLDDYKNRPEKFYDERSNEPYNHGRYDDERTYPSRPKNLQEHGKFGYTNALPAEHNQAPTHLQDGYQYKDAHKSSGGQPVDPIAAMYAQAYDRPNVVAKDTSSGNHKNAVDWETSNVDKGHVPSTPDPHKNFSQKMYPDLKISDKKSVGSISQSSNSGSQNVPKSSEEYWKHSNKPAKKPKNRFYKMPIIDTGDILRIRDFDRESNARAVAGSELNGREATMTEKSIGNRFLFFLPDGELSTQIDVYDVIMEGGRKLSSKYVKNSGSTAMFTNIRKIDEIQGKEHKMGEKEISRKEFEQIQRLVDTREGTFIY